MNIKTFGATVSVALLFSAAQATAVTLVIDSFDTNQSVSDVPSASLTNTSTVTSEDGDIIGGTRTMSVENTATDGNPTNATSLESFDGFLAFSNDDGAKGRGSLFYDGGGAGLGSLAVGPKPFFFFDVRRFDNNGNLDFAVNGTDAGGNTITYTENVSSGAFSPRLFFSQFSGAESFDFTNVASLEFTVDTTDTVISVDGAIESITVAPIPVPASALLLLGGLGGMGGLTALRRRRKS